MMTQGSAKPSWSVGQWITVGLLGVIAISLLVIVFSLVWDKGSGKQASEEASRTSDAQVAVPSGQTAKREDLPKPPPPPPTIGKPDRIQDVLLQGRTYEVTSNVYLSAPVRSREWGFERTVYLNYLAEVHFIRRIDKNDGQRIEEFRDIKRSRMLKAESTVEVYFVFSGPAGIILNGLDLITGGLAGRVIAAGIGSLEGLLDSQSRRLLNEQNTKVRAAIESLEGKQVRIAYEDGKGVVELEPAGCDLTEEERNFLMALSVVSDAYLFPDEKSKPGDTWEVPAEAFSDYLPPSWRAQPEGSVVVKRVEDFQRDGHQFARLEVQSGSFEIDATDQSRQRIGSLTPQGWLEYDITEGHVTEARLSAKASAVEASRDHLLFETRFEAQPDVRIKYACRLE